jgi:hypothetical protein
MRKVATRGVVQLFNAIRVAQKTAEQVAGKDTVQAKDQEVPVVRKRTFLDMLKYGPTTTVSEHDAALPAVTAAPAAVPASTTGTNATEAVAWMRDDFMTAKATKHWDEDSE